MGKNKHQILSFLGFKYIRIIAEEVNPSEINNLKSKFSYIVVYSYKKPALPDFQIRTQKISVIDLTHDLNSIFNAFRKNTRNEIRKSEKIDGLEFKNADSSYSTSYKFYKKIKKRDGAVPDIRTEFIGSMFFNSYLKGRMIVSVSCYDTGKILRLKHVVSSRKDGKIEGKIAGFATRRIIWEICKYGKKYGYEKLDLAGVNMDDPSKMGIADFKQSFGGESVENYISRYETKPFRFARKILAMLNMNIN